MADLLPPPTTEQADEKVDNSNLTHPDGYEDDHMEAFNLPCYFKGFYLKYSAAFFDKKLNISSWMGPEHYMFDASYFGPKLAFVGNVTTSGSLSAGVKAFITDKLIVKAKTELENARLSMSLVKFEYQALNYRAQLELKNTDLLATYFQRVTPRLSLGGHVYNFGVPKQWGVGHAARYETDDKMIAAAFVDISGLVFMNYAHKISKKVSLITDFEYECFSRYVKASVGCVTAIMDR
ncbi:PREDICTED: mitochondrial import receptor subunit TOM40-1-like [Camelina sativa]|uniref:Mitochondrial import receptor subunit TOM40-1-like n=1 Tax=Camelina sativa TaxID=90675 RepID=A0ABM0X4D5_CAMSA|nr:PREDICTED: mitochondrial import receptor subunit TOM40-1-like [Camelina sativa]